MLAELPRRSAAPAPKGGGERVWILVTDSGGDGVDGSLGLTEQLIGALHSQVCQVLHGGTAKKLDAEAMKLRVAEVQATRQYRHGPFIRQSRADIAPQGDGVGA